MRTLVRTLLSASVLAAGASAPLVALGAESAGPTAADTPAEPRNATREAARDETVAEILQRLRRETGQQAEPARRLGEAPSTEEAISAYQARVQKKLDDDERTWNRITTSICSGCGVAVRGARAASVTPGDVLARQAPAAGALARAPAAEPAGTRLAEAARPRLRYARLRRQLLGQPQHADSGQKAGQKAAAEAAVAARPKVAGQRPVASAARKRLRYAAYRRQILGQPRAIAGIRRRVRAAWLRPGGSLHRTRQARERMLLTRRYEGKSRRAAMRARLVAYLDGSWASSRGRNHSLPHPVRRHDALCTYGYGPIVPASLQQETCLTGR
ncbi:hypothetical protein [Methylobacterium oxalidis]|uniref:Uncharacterized protein n=1 Tax=Methylobacterium oxalidis TaxID=944322 RepID=A0A512J626_9HYPH|nr:hypothetical protein [Methylobacterium oxalidis]GEP05360.1 hypothetical protein MOX02_33980 [Methylobacterium oxalidis]GJE31370.1 hypothetical protein LDDCCGHA_1547 [Methylobacterium oxalidis]GLS63502.1 hypothetical protein GCM10007888_18830 [Methylobacterium oxalidis]